MDSRTIHSIQKATNFERKTHLSTMLSMTSVTINMGLNSKIPRISTNIAVKSIMKSVQ